MLITAAFIGLIGSFLIAIFWAVVFAILFYPRFEKILARMPHWPNMAAALTLIMVILVAIVPVTLVGLAVYAEAQDIIESIQESDTVLELQMSDIQENIPLDEKQLRQLGITAGDIEEKLKELIEFGTRFISGKAVDITRNTIGIFVNFTLMLYILFFFLRDGKRLVQELMWVIPIKDKAEETLFQRFESVTRATVKGSLLIAFIQGTLGGIIFWILGIKAAFLWGVIMTIAALLPVGSVLIWGPWVAALFYQGESLKAVILLIVGALLIGLIDNLLRPRLVGRDTKMPDYLVLLSTLGGLIWFGLTGFVLGPIIAALFVTCWQILGKEYGKPFDEVVTYPTAEELAAGTEPEEH